jgi:hypothetical protein
LEAANRTKLTKPRCRFTRVVAHPMRRELGVGKTRPSSPNPLSAHSAHRGGGGHTFDDALAPAKQSRSSRELGAAGNFSADVPQMDLQQACA